MKFTSVHPFVLVCIEGIFPINACSFNPSKFAGENALTKISLRSLSPSLPFLLFLLHALYTFYQSLFPFSQRKKKKKNSLSNNFIGFIRLASLDVLSPFHFIIERHRWKASLKFMHYFLAKCTKRENFILEAVWQAIDTQLQIKGVKEKKKRGNLQSLTLDHVYYTAENLLLR